MNKVIIITAILFCNISFSQSITISDSSITYNVSAFSYAVNTPYAPVYEYSYGQSIYLENDIQGKGTINALTFYYNGLYLNHSDSLTVYLGITQLDYLDSVGAIKTSAMHQVFQGTIANYSVPGPITIILDTSFYYNGDSNLVIAVNETKVGQDTPVTNYFAGFYHFYSNNNRGLSWGNFLPWQLSYFDLTPGAYPTSGGGTPKITIHGLTHLPCQSPKFVHFSNITHDSAKITWLPPDSGNTPIGYDIYYSTSRYKPASFISTPYTSAVTIFTATGLNPSSWYYAWVRTRSTNCTSVWTVVDSFKTLCTPTATPTPQEPFNHQFASLFPPNCWERARGLLTTSSQLIPETDYQYWVGAPYRHQAGSDSAAKAYIRTDTLRHWLISPPYDLGTGSNKNLEFDAAFTKNGSQIQANFDADDKFIVVISTDEGQTWSNANILRTWASPQTISSVGTHIIIPLTAYSGIVRIGFYVQSTNGNPVGSSIPTLFIDNVKISEILPVTLTDFTGKKEGSNNLLQWHTATEQNNKGFELQRAAPSNSPGGGDLQFSTIAFVPTQARGGNSTNILSYQFTDQNPISGGKGTYYRLKQIDFDGKATLSNVVLIKGAEMKDLVLSALYPNPTKQLLNLSLTTRNKERVTVFITDMAGKIVQQQTLELQVGENNKVLNVMALQKGSYIVKVVCDIGGEAAVSKFVKQ